MGAKAKNPAKRLNLTAFGDVEAKVLGTLPNVRRVWDETEPRRKIIMMLIGLRRNAGLSQSDIAARTGWDKGYVSRLEGARGGIPDFSTLNRYAEVCGTTAGLVVGARSDSTHMRIVDAVALDFGAGMTDSNPFEGLKNTEILLGEVEKSEETA